MNKLILFNLFQNNITTNNNQVKGMNSSYKMSVTRLSSIENFNTESIIFSDAKETAIPGSFRITIGVQHKDGAIGPLIFSTDNLYSFGIQENKSLDKPIRTTGYSIPLCLWSRDGPTEYQENFISTIEQVSEHIKKYILKPDVKKALKKYDLVESDLRKFNPLWYKKEDGKIVEGRGPMLYPKLMCDKNLKIYSVFANQNGMDINPMSLIGQRFNCRTCIKIESIFIGAKISLQIKVLEVEVYQQGNQRQRLICRTPPPEEEKEFGVYEDMEVTNPLRDEKLFSSEVNREIEERKLEYSSGEEEVQVQVQIPQEKKKPSTRGGRRFKQ